ncbi:two component sensor histidine kinase [Desulfocucumis palustris]|uniref:histidine kinase n=1 Tax=Desulfocucumis palustris TaxID=1898651 RepID=A0A2L2X979_9FIRM|nr:sensor histidine kinase [Desulfocucumis palustris]GBF32582.1 two component sensor histidine kinase [Desulfocucumis palustris]
MPSEASILDKVVKDTISAIETGKRQIYDIAEHTMAEYNRLKNELAEVKKEVVDLIDEVDNLALLERKARVRLAEVSKNFHLYTEADIKKAYEDVQDKKLRLMDLKGREKLLRYKRDNLELSLRRIKDMLDKAEKLASHLAAVTNYLNSDLANITSRFLELEQLQNLGVNIIRAQEEERRKVARDIHDGPAQLLANIVMRAEFCLKLMEIDHNKVKEELTALQQMVRQSLQDVRKIIFDLRPMVLDDLGLIPAIRRYFEEFTAEAGLTAELVTTGDNRRFATTIEVALFRVFQECLSNIRKHAAATQLLVKIEVLHNKVNMSVKDNGAGFNPKNVMADKKSEGYGLIGMRERIQILKGEFSVTSVPKKGTSIHISVPLED